MNDERERRITARAFELWQKEGAPHGRALIHWLQAEKEIADADEVVAEDRTDLIGLATAANPTH